tara:strand:+ start:961 stop:2091 length:1131 start_codon:yes stop_codon:yes gene_type:complete
VKHIMTIYYLKALFSLLVLLALTGLLEQSSLAYIQNIAEKNIGFLGLITEIKMILSGISDFVPFLKGHSDSLNSSFTKAENYLLIVNGLSLVELMLIGISNSWLFKALLMILLIISLIRKSGSLSAKLLVIALAINPGLQLFSVTMDHLSKSSSIDYGESYYSELQQSVQELKQEKAQLSQQHEKNLTAINNGDKKGLDFFKKLKEDISYDVKKAKTSINGDFKNLRIIVHDGGKELIRKITIFCSMVIFSLLLMPVGYGVIVYTIYKSVMIPATMSQMKDVEQEVLSTPKAWGENLITKFNNMKGNIEDKANELESDKKSLESRVNHEVEEVVSDAKPEKLEELSSQTLTGKKETAELEKIDQTLSSSKPPPISI